MKPVKLFFLVLVLMFIAVGYGEKLARSPLHVAAAVGDIDQIQSLISEGADVNAKARGVQTPLFVAKARKGKEQYEIIELLREHGAKE